MIVAALSMVVIAATIAVRVRTRRQIARMGRSSFPCDGDYDEVLPPPELGGPRG